MHTKWKPKNWYFDNFFFFAHFNLRLFNKAHWSHDSFFIIVRYVLIAIFTLLDHSRSIMGATCWVFKWNYIWIELYYWYIICRKNRSSRQRRNDPRNVFNGFPRIWFVNCTFYLSYRYSLNYFIGASLGSTVVGYTFSRLGSIMAFRLISLIAFIICMVQVIVNHFMKWSTKII